jgi:type 1 fimbria pilin
MMKRTLSAVVLAASLILTASAFAKDSAKKTITGEIVDTGCFLGHMGQGAKHVECATKCINQGMPMGVLTRQGTLYLITMDHDNPDFYNKLKGMAGKNVAVTGQLYTRAGMKAIEVTGFRQARA